MNFFVLTLALAIIVGSQGFVLHDAPAPPSKTHEFIQAAINVYEAVDSAIDKKLDIIAKSETVKAISDALDEEDDKSPDPQLPAEAQASVKRLFGFIDAVDDLADKAIDLAFEIENKTETTVKKMALVFAHFLAPHLDPVLEKMEPYCERVQQAFAKLKEVDHKLDEDLKTHMAAVDSQMLEHIQKWRPSRGSQQKAAK